jgi:PST family polysaccharide transporter
VLLIGSFLGYNEVAYYDLAEKITNVMKIPFTILNQALYPNVSVTKNITLVKKFLKILLIFYIFNYLSIFLWGRQAVILLGSQKLLPAVNVLYLLAITAITELVVVFLGAPILLVSGFKKEYNLSIIYGSLFYCLLIAVLYIFNLMGLYQLVVCSVLSSCFILLYRFYYTRRYNLL